jgi:outer membrane lipoprotein-sorting protein
MKKLIITLLFIICHLTIGSVAAQSAKSVLDKCAATVSAKDGVQASFQMKSTKMGETSGTIAVKGKMFHASTSVATMWFDGKTQWTYLKSNDEVSVTTPTEAQLQVINPYNFINMYKKGFKYTMTKSASAYIVHLTSTDKKRKVQEMFITIDKKSYAPTEVKLLQGTQWTNFTITNLKKAKLDDSMFRFNSKDFPQAEVIDLR